MHSVINAQVQVLVCITLCMCTYTHTPTHLSLQHTSKHPPAHTHTPLTSAHTLRCKPPTPTHAPHLCVHLQVSDVDIVVLLSKALHKLQPLVEIEEHLETRRSELLMLMRCKLEERERERNVVGLNS